MTIRSALSLAAILPAVVLAAACVIVREEEDGRTTELNIATPVGALAARTDKDAGDTGLPVYPGARPAQDDDDSDRANVSIGTPWFGLHVIAAEYESGDAPERIVDFYRERMQTYGAVTECRGDVNFKGSRAVCREKRSSREIQLIAGTEERHRIVAVKPRGSGSEFALVSIQTGVKR